MTTINPASDFGSIIDSAELPRPDMNSDVDSSPAVGSKPRPLPNIDDSGRISFGAACRLPVRK